MAKQLFYLVILSLITSCKSGGQDGKPETSSKPGNKPAMREIRGVRFAFKAKRMDAFKETIEISATLYNDNSDTVYFLTSTCEGEQYSLRYDTAKLEPRSFLNCEFDFPKVAKIAPKRHYDFRSHFGSKLGEERIKLGFDFYSVDKLLDLRNKTMADLHIFNRPAHEQTIIWADDVMIKE